MAFWCRIGGTHKFRSIVSRQCTRWLHIAHRMAPESRRVGYEEKSVGGLPTNRSAIAQFTPVRFLAAPVSNKKAREKAREKEASGSRTNEEIEAKYVRLVTDEGHGIVTRKEALDRARMLDLDLVEVSREADPPVCKIMDFHKEKFKKQAKVKELAKTKADTSLRKGDCKEVKFTGKIENKDLELKAETVKRLMERGYRVKVVAEAGKQAGSFDAGKEDLSKVLSRLYSLIEDVSALESPPLVKEKMAYLIVRHAKFGTKKISPKKTNEGDEVKGSGVQLRPSTLHLLIDTSKQATEVPETSEAGSKTEVFHVTRPFFHSPLSPGMEKSKFNPSYHKGDKTAPDTVKGKTDYKIEQRDGCIPSSPSLRPAPSPEQSNRYRKSGQPTPRTPSRPPFVKIQDESVLDLKQHHSIPGNNNAPRRVPSQPHERKQNGNGAGWKNEKPPPGPSSPPMSFGMFSTPKTGAPDPAVLKRNAEKNTSDTDIHPQFKDETRQRDWGIFSK